MVFTRHSTTQSCKKMEQSEELIRAESQNLENLREPYERALANDHESLKRYYQNKPANLFCRVTSARDTIFHIAAYKGSEQLLKVLCEMVPPCKLIEVLKMKNIYGNTILHEAATAEKVEAVRFLIQMLLSPEDAQIREQILEERNKLGETPLYRAAAFGKTKIVDYLAREVKKVGKDVRVHFRRKDGVPILNIAVLGQHFETAIWLLKSYEELATYTDKSGKTSLHLLANMPEAFHSTSNSSRIHNFVYNFLPSDLSDDDTTHPESTQHKDLETGNPSQRVSHSKCKIGSGIHHAFSKWLVNEWAPVGKIYEQKKMHESAVELAKMLVKIDASWFVPYEPEEDNTICLSRDTSDDQKAVPITEEEGFYRHKNAATISPETPLLIAASTGITEIFYEILKLFPQAMEHVNKEGQNILHIAIMHRQYDIFDRVKNNEVTKRRLVQEIDNNGFTILHHAAEMQYYRGGTRPSAALKLQEEWKWFKDVKDTMPPHYTMHRNKSNQTAEQLFKIKHKDQHDEAKQWVKDTSQSCSTVAVLVATVVFAAAFTVPGGSDNYTGLPLLLKRPMYSVFTVMDVAALATSLSSVVMFLSVLTSSLELKDFAWIIPRKLSLGFTFLFFSVTTTVLSFSVTIILTIQLKKRWTTTLTYAAAFLPIAMFALVQFPLYFEFLWTALKGIHELIRKILPNPSRK